MTVLCSEIAAVLGCKTDSAGVKTPVVIHYEYGVTAAGARQLNATRYTDAAGAPFALAVGDVVVPGECVAAVPPPSVEKIVVPLDAAGSTLGLAVREVRTFNADGTLASVVYRDTVTNAVVTLPAGTAELVESVQIDTEVVAMCDGGVPFLRRFSYHPGGVLAGFTDTTADGATAYVLVGTPTPGDCQVAPPDVELVTMCDVQANGTVVEFIRRTVTTFDTANVPTTTRSDLTADLTTAYVATGTVGICSQACDPVTPVGLVATWG